MTFMSFKREKGVGIVNVISTNVYVEYRPKSEPAKLKANAKNFIVPSVVYFRITAKSFLQRYLRYAIFFSVELLGDLQKILGY